MSASVTDRTLDNLERRVNPFESQRDIPAIGHREGRHSECIAVVPPLDIIRRAADCENRVAWIFTAVGNKAVKSRRGVAEDKVLHQNPRREFVGGGKVWRRLGRQITEAFFVHGVSHADETAIKHGPARIIRSACLLRCLYY